MGTRQASCRLLEDSAPLLDGADGLSPGSVAQVEGLAYGRTGELTSVQAVGYPVRRPVHIEGRKRWYERPRPTRTMMLAAPVGVQSPTDECRWRRVQVCTLGNHSRRGKS